MSGGYLIYHPKRTAGTFGKTNVYFDNTIGNQDPYVWNTNFLHTYCHMAQISSKNGDICFWVNGDRWPKFSNLYCDLVFVVAQKIYWNQANKIAQSDTVVDSAEAWQDHYCWGNKQHQYKRRRRYTLKADSLKSFQPQDVHGELIDIAPFLVRSGYTIGSLRQNSRGIRGSKPFRIDDLALSLYDWLFKNSELKLFGRDLRTIRLANQDLASSDEASSCC